MSFPRYSAYKDSGVEWLGEVPAHWDVGPIKRRIRNIESGTSVNSSDECANDGKFGVLKTSCVYTGAFNPDENKTVVGEDIHRVSCPVKAGTLIVSRMNTPDLIGAAGFVSQTREDLFLPDRLWQITFFNAEARFVHYWTLTGLYRGQVQAACTGTSSSMKNLGQDQFGCFHFAAPPAAEQTQIAAFLDRETAKIDELVAEQRRLMELLKEKRQAVISHAVTKGLNPDAPMKPSGIEWLGEVPAHWRVMSLGRVTVSRCDGPFGSGLKSEHYTDAGVRVIRLQNIRRDGFNGFDEAFIDADYFKSNLSGHEVVSGDVLIAGLGDDKNTVGRACVAPVGIEPAMVKADCFRFRLDNAQAFPEFISTQLSASSEADAGVMSSGSTRSRIPLSVMATRKLVIPPVAEQIEIADFIGAEVLNFDTLTAEAQRAIDLLQERRTALISAAVTGQIDVRQLPERQAA